jgi:hypothetical protein
LGVDALLVVQLTLSYSSEGAEGDLVPIAVSVELGAVDQKGRVVLDSGTSPVVYQGPAVALLQGGRVTLGPPNGEVATAYRKLINDAANGLALRINSELLAGGERGR